jgi:hypothetical protein
MKKRLVAMVLALPLVISAAAFAAKPDALPLGKFGRWEAAYFTDGGNKVCFMAAAPAATTSSTPMKGRDPNVLLFITHWPADKQKDAITLSSGYPFKEGSEATIAIAGKTFTFSTGGAGTGADPDMAWMEDNKKETELAEDIRRGESLTFRGTSKRGTVITDTYSLKGSSDAYRAISKACGY